MAILNDVDRTSLATDFYEARILYLDLMYWQSALDPTQIRLDVLFL